VRDILKSFVGTGLLNFAAEFGVVGSLIAVVTVSVVFWSAENYGGIHGGDCGDQVDHPAW